MTVLDLTKRAEKGSPISATEHDQNLTDIETQVNLNTLAASGGKSKLDATAAPTANDDSGDGYGIGSLWVNISADKSYICLDATVTAAVWHETGVDDHVNLSNIGTNTHAQIDTKLSDNIAAIGLNTTHRGVTSGNPHAVTKTELGLDNVTNDEQLKKGTQWNVDITAKATPVNADLILSEDSAASFVKKKSTWTQIKAFLKTYFDTLYSTITHASTHTDGNDDIQSATNAVKGLATAAQITKLEGVETGSTKYPDTGEQAFLDADHTKLNAIEAEADVTRTTNVIAAGAVMNSDISPSEGFLRKTGVEAYTAIKSNLNASVDPTVNEDSGDGYGVGSIWINTTVDGLFTCLDATVGAAVWASSGGTSDSNAIHDNVTAEISAIAEKTTPVAADLILIEDSAASNAKKKIQVGNISNPSDYVKVSDVKAYNVAGGTFTQDAWRTRDINTEDSDASAICSIASNQITLAAGTYICQISARAYKIIIHTGRLYNITDSAIELLSSGGYAESTTSVENRMLISGKFTIAAQKTFEVQHYCTSTYASNGFGVPNNISGVNNVYTIAEFWRIAT